MGVVNVIGAGPVGLHCAAMLAEEGFDTSVFEEHSAIGRPAQCAGLVSKSGIEHLGVELGNSVVNEVRGARIFSPGGESITVERNEAVAYVIDRFLFDQMFYKKAKRLGCEIRTETKLIDVRSSGLLQSKSPGNIPGGSSLFLQSRGHGELLKSKITVGADGANSVVRHSVFPGLFKKDFVHAVQLKAEGKFDKDLVEMHFGSFAPGFFAWVVPLSSSIARIGLGVRPGKSAASAMRDFLQQKRLNIKTMSKSSALIPVAKPAKRLVAGSVLLVGDAAGQTKATSVDFEESMPIFEGGLVKTVRIGEWVNSQMQKQDASIIRQKEPPNVAVLTDCFEASAFAPEKDASKPCFRKISSILKHRHHEKLFEVVLEKGFRIKVTGSHSVMVAGKDCFEEKKASELKKGKDLLTLMLNVPNNEALCEVNILDLIWNLPMEIKDNIRIRKAKDRIHWKELPKACRRAWQADSIPLSLLPEKIKNMADIKVYFKNSDIGLQPKIRITEEFCRLLGYFTAEGGTKNGKNTTLSFGSSSIEREFVQDAIGCVQKTFACNIQTKKQYNPVTGKENGIKITFGGALVSLLFSKLLKAGSKTKAKEVPFIVFNVKNKLKLEFLKAYLHGDGTLRIRNNKNSRHRSAELSCKTVSRKLASDLVFLSLQLGMFPSVESFDSIERFWNGKKISSSKGYRIVFSRKEDLILLADAFRGKKERLLKFLQQVKPRATVLLPKKYLEQHNGRRFSNCILKEFGPSIYSGYSGISYGRLQKLALTKQLQTSNFTTNLLNEQIVLLKVKQIKKVAPTTSEVFDVEIPENHMFTAGLGPILLHNTGGGLVFGLKAAEACAETIANHLKHRHHLENYSKKLQQLNKELAMHWKIYSYIQGLRPSQFDSLFRKARDAGIERFLQEYGDMDKPSLFMRKVLFKPKMWGLLPAVLKAI